MELEPRPTSKHDWIRNVVLDELATGVKPVAFPFEDYKEAVKVAKIVKTVNQKPAKRSWVRKLPPTLEANATVRADKGGGILWVWLEECEKRW